MRIRLMLSTPLQCIVFSVACRHCMLVGLDQSTILRTCLGIALKPPITPVPQHTACSVPSNYEPAHANSCSPAEFPHCSELCIYITPHIGLSRIVQAARPHPIVTHTPPCGMGALHLQHAWPTTHGKKNEKKRLPLRPYSPQPPPHSGCTQSPWATCHLAPSPTRSTRHNPLPVRPTHMGHTATMCHAMNISCRPLPSLPCPFLEAAVPRQPPHANQGMPTDSQPPPAA